VRLQIKWQLLCSPHFCALSRNASNEFVNKVLEIKAHNRFSTGVNNSKIQAEGRFCYIRSDEPGFDEPDHRKNIKNHQSLHLNHHAHKH